MYAGTSSSSSSSAYDGDDAPKLNINVSITGRNGNIIQIYDLLTPEKAIFIAGPTISSLLQHEIAIIAMARSIDTAGIDAQFQKLLKLGSTDFNGMYTHVIESRDALGLEILTNFSEYFESRIDLMRRCGVEDATPQATLEPVVQVQDPSATNDDESPLAKKHKKTL